MVGGQASVGRRQGGKEEKEKGREKKEPNPGLDNEVDEVDGVAEGLGVQGLDPCCHPIYAPHSGSLK